MKTICTNEGFTIEDADGKVMVIGDVHRTNTVIFSERFMNLPTWGDKLPYVKQTVEIISTYNEDTSTAYKQKLTDMFALSWKQDVIAKYKGLFI